MDRGEIQGPTDGIRECYCVTAEPLLMEDLPTRGVIVCVDYLLIFSTEIDEYRRLVLEVLKRLSERYGHIGVCKGIAHLLGPNSLSAWECRGIEEDKSNSSRTR